RFDERAARGGGGSRCARRRRHGIRGPGRLSYAGGARARRCDDRARPGAPRVGGTTGRGPAVPLGGPAVRAPRRGRGAHRHGARRRRRRAGHPRRGWRRDCAGPRVGGGDGKPYGLPLARVLEVGDLGEVLDVPRALAAVRGVTPLRGRLVPLIHLGALLGERSPPPDRGRTAVLVELGAGEGVRRVALEVDDADDVVRETALPVPRGESLPWAAGVARRKGTLVPILDLDALGDRITCV